VETGKGDKYAIRKPKHENWKCVEIAVQIRLTVLPTVQEFQVRRREIYVKFLFPALLEFCQHLHSYYRLSGCAASLLMPVALQFWFGISSVLSKAKKLSELPQYCSSTKLQILNSQIEAHIVIST
jgi:hypothetical protein